ncbi:hypothetical protein [Croceicoccus sp. BE223]|uniref:hypothetical protein n=1 Tax=Croceicoccus sp. BE223 TaxID=2817716 RepID=UPI0028622D05|nr:hypothetical protein [Croceicoccus sp. BE223]MDR7100928.1 hypothetical protein [Croceicoccus sp. BE223]
MSVSNRRKLPPIGTLTVGLIAFSITLFLWHSANGLDRQNQIAAEQRREQYADEAQKQVGRDCANLPAPELAKCSYPTIAAYRETQRNESDLEAQQVMAIWTRTMGQVAVIGMGIGIFSLWLIFTTFRETRRAAEIAERNFEAFAKIEAGSLTVEFSKTPTFFIEDERLWMRFGLKCVNVGRSPVAVIAVEVESLERLSYGFICKAEDDATFSGTRKVAVDGKTVIRGFIEYSTPVETNVRRRFRIGLTLNDRPSLCKASIFTGGILRKGDTNYEKALD